MASAQNVGHNRIFGAKLYFQRQSNHGIPARTGAADQSESESAAGTDQIDRVLAQFSSKTSRGTAVHEARKAMKRLRALLHLVKPAMPKGSFAASEARLKKIGRSLSGARDAQAMLETVRKLEAHDGSAKVKQVTAALRAQLQAECAEAENRLTGAGIKQLRKLLNEAKAGFAEMSLEPDDFSVVAVTLERDYRKARRAFSQAYRLRQTRRFMTGANVCSGIGGSCCWLRRAGRRRSGRTSPSRAMCPRPSAKITTLRCLPRG